MAAGVTLTGKPVPRVEDQRLLTGRGRFVDDLAPAGMVPGVVVRSPHAHARILGLDVEAARAMPGVLAVLTPADVAGLGGLPTDGPNTGRLLRPLVRPHRPALAADIVRHVGDPVAFVVAETLAQARDAAEAVAVDYDPLPAVIDLQAAIAADAPQLWPEAPGNIVFDWEIGDAAATEAAFAAAARVVRLELVNNRLALAPVEPRSAIARFDPADGYRLDTQTQGVHRMRDAFAAVFGEPPERFHVVTGDVGGSFGLKEMEFPEQVLVAAAAKRLDRPVAWTAERSESFISDIDARGHLTTAELALDAEGRFLAIRVDTLADLGAHLSTFGPRIATSVYGQLVGQAYRIPALHVRVRGVFTNTVPTDAYRGAGVPEACYLTERLVDAAARETGIDRVELRLRNLLTPEMLPYTTPTGLVVDTGDFAGVVRAALDVADWQGFTARREASAARGRRRGIGLAFYMHATGGAQTEHSRVQVASDGKVTVDSGVQATGQGHETAFAQLVADALGVPLDQITVRQGDSRILANGAGSGGSNSLPTGATTILRAADDLIAKSREIAATLMEAATADVAFEPGGFRIVGTDRFVGWPEVAAAAERQGAGCAGSGKFEGDRRSFPHGVLVMEVEADPDTGRIEILSCTGVEDVGHMLNPLITDGQLHGGIAQGIGQALMEAVVHDPDSGQLLTGSLMDYALPRAADLPSFSHTKRMTPAKNNRLGMKGVGEIGTIGAPPALMNAIVDALGGRAVDMPATPEAVWRALSA